MNLFGQIDWKIILCLALAEISDDDLLAELSVDPEKGVL